MRKIDKGHEPVEWERYRNSPGASFDGAGSKDAKERLRQALIIEQGFVCAYCQRRIALSGATRIEHIISQSVLKGEPGDKDPERPSDRWWFEDKERYFGQFDEMYYRNLVLCCDGNISGSRYGRQREEDFHCDRSKGEHCVHFDIFLQQFIDTLSYETGSGKIKSTNTLFHKEITEVLNLNQDRLCRNRLEAIVAVKTALDRLGWKRSTIERMLETYSIPSDGGRHTPYDGFITWYLRRALRGCGG